jgi:hypothetical protein
MNSNGDYPSIYSGVGQERAPSLSFGHEPTTGVYLESPGSSSSYTISKRGTKRMRIDDTKTQIIGPLETDGMIVSGQLLLPDGSQSAPSLSWESNPSDGFWHFGAPTPAIVTSIDGVIKGAVEADRTIIEPRLEVPEISVEDGTESDASIKGLTVGMGIYMNSTGIGVAVDNKTKLHVGSALNESQQNFTTGTNAMLCGSMVSSGPITATGHIIQGATMLASNKVAVGNTGSVVNHDRVLIEGASASSTCPAIMHQISGDNNPIMQTLAYARDNEYINFDCYFNGFWRSSNTTSNFQIAKRANTLSINYHPGGALGSTITPISTTSAMSVSSTGSVTFTDSIALTTAGKTISLKRGTGASLSGTGVVLVAGTSGAVTCTSIAAGDQVVLTCTAAGGTPGVPTVTISPGSSFTITSSSATDTSTYSYFIVKGN